MNGMINKTIFDKIYVISLIHNHDRQEFIKYQMNHIGLNFEFIYGIDFYNLINDSKDNRKTKCNKQRNVAFKNTISKKFWVCNNTL